MTPDEPRRSTSAGAVAGGIVLGLIGAFCYMVFAFLVSYSMANDGSAPDWIWLVLIAAPAILGVLLLAFPRTRRAGAGFVMGLAIGMIAVPATCVVPFLGV